MSINKPSDGSKSTNKYHKVATGEPIRKILSESDESKIIANQEQKLNTLIYIENIKKMEGLAENLKAKQDTNELYKILQIACSDPKYFFVDNGRLVFDKQSAQNNRRIYQELVDYVLIIPSTLPTSFLQQFDIKEVDPQAQNIKDIFNLAKPLRYMDQTKQKYTNRVLFHQGKIIVFRTVKTMLSYSKPNTVGEKRKHDTNKYFNTYGSIYDAIRSQEYIVEGQEQSANDIKTLQKTIIELIFDIKMDTKNGEIHRKLDAIQNEIQNAKSHHIVAAQIHNLNSIFGKHSEIEKQHLVGAKNKFSKRIADIKKYVAMIDIQTNEMKNILHELEYTLETLHANFFANIAFDGTKNKEILFTFEKFFSNKSKLDYIPDPFAKFFEQITMYLGKSTDDIKKYGVEEFMIKAAMLFVLQRISLTVSKIEHQIKLGEKTYEEINLLDELHIIENIAKYPQISQVYGTFFSSLLEVIEDLDYFMKNPNGKEEEIQKHWDELKNIITKNLF
ncbi:MAG: hypothetical protein PHR61_01370 [Candidatus Absconditabacteria bacterium]|nr:hypothetical protein [Candidatus Absconditabacteria bacterium]